MIAAIKYNGYTTRGPCSLCGAPGPVGVAHPLKVHKSAHKPTKRTDCGGTFLPKIKKHQGGRVKRYRQELKAAKIKFKEHMFINTCLCGRGFGSICEPGQMVVVFTWGDQYV